MNQLVLLSPPAIVRPATDLAQLARRINDLHAQAEASYQRSLEDIRLAGLALAEAKRQVGHGGWEEWVEANLTVGVRTAQRWMRIAAKSDTVSLLPPTLRGAIDALAEHRPVKPEREKTWVEKNSGCEEWYTPARYIEAAREVMGCIDLDPASSDIAQRTVQATTFYTKELDGLEQEWAGNVWINPPYAARVIDQFVEKLVGHFLAGEVEQAVVLTNNATDTGWFQRLAREASAICFPAGRVRFLDPDGVEGAPLQGQAVTYLGDRPESFAKRFAGFGQVVNSKLVQQVERILDPLSSVVH